MISTVTKLNIQKNLLSEYVTWLNCITEVDLGLH